MPIELHQKLMHSKRCYVTGASGALGSEIRNQLHLTDGIEIVALCRDANNSYFHDLQIHDQEKITVDKFLVHCGWDTRDRTLAAQSKSKSETLNLAKYCQEHEIRLIFISSQSAVLGTRSNYGTMKIVAEQLVAEHNGISLKPGLILFNPAAGIQKKLCAPSLYRLRVKLYPNVNISVIEISDLIHDLRIAFNESTLSGSIVAVRNRSVPINSLTELPRHRFHLVIPIPLRLLHSVIRLVGLIRGHVLAIDDSLSAILT